MAKLIIYLLILSYLDISLQQYDFHEAFSRQQWEYGSCAELTKEDGPCAFEFKGFMESFYADSMLRYLSDTFSSGNYSGYRLIDIGTGPSLHSVISASDYFEHILVSQSTDGGCQEIRSWLKGKAEHTNLSAAIQYVSQLEGTRTPAEVESDLREKVKQVLKSDLRLENPFHPRHVEPADCVITSVCLSNRCGDSDLFQTMSNVATLVRQRGMLVILGILDTVVQVGGKSHQVVDLGLTNKLQDVLKAMWFYIVTNNVNVADKTSFYIVAIKGPLYV